MNLVEITNYFNLVMVVKTERKMDQDLQDTVTWLATQRSIAFSSYRPDLLGRIINRRAAAVNCDGLRDYLNYLKENDKELQELLDELTINVSKFFRNPLVFEILAEKILPPLILRKSQDNESLRIWSAGCAQGEEAYSLAILIKDFILRNAIGLKAHIFATDIDEDALEHAMAGKYCFEAIENIKAGLLKKYFKKNGKFYRVRPVIKEMVAFSVHDLLDKKTLVPPVSVFGDFDLVVCCNVLIYYRKGLQKIILRKLCRSIAPGGFLVLGEAETLPADSAGDFIAYHDRCLFQKIG